MLAITRAPNESIVIEARDGSRFTIEIAHIKGDRVRLAFDDPAKGFTFVRKELLENGQIPQAVRELKHAGRA